MMRLVLAITLLLVVTQVLGRASTNISTIYYPSVGSWDVDVDPNGRALYVSVSYPGVWRVTNGVTTAIAGGGASGYADGIGTAAKFSSSTYGIVSDGAGNAYITDSSRIRALALSSLTVTTLAGGASSGFTDGVGVSARFSGLIGIAYRSGGLYVADSSNGAIRRIVIATAVVTTITASTPYCQFLCIDTGGVNIYVSVRNAILRVTVQTGVVTTLAGSDVIGYVNGVGTASQFSEPAAVVLNNDEQSLIIADSHNFVVRKLNLRTLVTTTIAGSGSNGLLDGAPTKAQFRFIYGGKWYCNATSGLCGLIVSDYYSGTQNALRFVPVENFVTTSSSNDISASRSTSSSRTQLFSKSETLTSTESSSQTSEDNTESPSTTYRTTASAFSDSSTRSSSTTYRLTTTALSATQTADFLTLSKSSSPSLTTMGIGLTPMPSSSITNNKTSTSQSVSSASRTLSPSSSDCHNPLSLRFNAVATIPSTLSVYDSIAALCFNGTQAVGSCVFPQLSTDASLTASAAQTIWNFMAPAAATASGGGPTRLMFALLIGPSWTLESPLYDSNTTTTAKDAPGYEVSILVVPDDVLLVNATTTTNSSNEIIGATAGYLSIISVLLPSVPPDGSTMTFTNILQVRCSVEKVPLTMSVSWPKLVVSISTEVTTALATTTAAALGGDVAAAASLALVSMLSCSGKAPDPGVNAYAISFFYDLGPIAMILGNIGLALLCVLLQFALVQAIQMRRAQKQLNCGDISLGGEDDVGMSSSPSPLLPPPAAAATMRFPAVSIRFAEFLLPGTTFAACLAFWSMLASDVAVAMVGIAAVVACVVATQFLQQRHVLPRCMFEEYLGHYPTKSCDMEALLIFPKGQWFPKSMRRQFGPLVNAYVPTKEWSRTLQLLLSLMLAIVSAVGVASSGSRCGAGPWIVGAVHIVVALVLGLLLRPYRLPSDSLLAPLGTLLFGVVCLIKASGKEEFYSVSDALTTVMALVQLLRTVLSMWVAHRESQWFALKHQQQRRTKQSKFGQFLGLLWGDGGTSSGEEVHTKHSGEKELVPLSLETITLDAPMVTSSEDEIIFVNLPVEDVQARGVDSLEEQNVDSVAMKQSTGLAQRQPFEMLLDEDMELILPSLSDDDDDDDDDGRRIKKHQNQKKLSAETAAVYCGIDGYFIAENSGDDLPIAIPGRAAPHGEVKLIVEI